MQILALVRLIPLASLLVGSHGHIQIPEYNLYYKIYIIFIIYFIFEYILLIFHLNRLLSKMVARGIKRTSAQIFITKCLSFRLDLVSFFQGYRLCIRETLHLNNPFPKKIKSSDTRPAVINNIRCHPY